MFTNQQVFWLLCLLPLLLLPELWRARKRQLSLRGLKENQQLSRLLRVHQPVRRLPTLLFRLLAFVLAVCALAKPEWGTELADRYQKGKKLYLALDLSRSMWAEDVGLNRLERAKLLARDLIQAHPGQPIGLISFTNQAFLEVATTPDSEALLEQLNYLSPASAFGDGTDLTKPVSLVHDLSDSQDNSLLILLSDGENLSEERLDSLAELDLKRIPILAIGIGTPEGSVIPDPELPGGFVRDSSDQLVLSRLETPLLQELAALSGGSYHSHSQARQIFAWVDKQLQSSEQQAEVLFSEEVPRSQYTLFLALALLSLLLGELLRSSWAQNWNKQTTKQPSPSSPRKSTSLLALLLLPICFISTTKPAAAQSIEHRQNQQNSHSPAHAASLAPSVAPPQKRYLEALQTSWDELKQQDYQSALAQSSSVLLSPNSQHQAEAHTHLAHALHARGLDQFQQALQAANNTQPEAQAGNLSEAEIPWQRIARDWQDALEHLQSASQLKPNSQLQAQQQTIAENLEALEQLQRQPPPEQDQASSANQEQNNSAEETNSQADSSDSDQASDQNPENSSESTTEESPEDNSDGNPAENPQDNPENNSESNPAENPQDNPEDNSESNPAETPQDDSQENPDSSSGAETPTDPPEDSNDSASATSDSPPSESPQSPTDQPSNPDSPPDLSNSQANFEDLQQSDSARIQEQLLRGYADEVPNLLGDQKQRNRRKRSW